MYYMQVLTLLFSHGKMRRVNGVVGCDEEPTASFGCGSLALNASCGSCFTAK
jgi:hypothetical protein